MKNTSLSKQNHHLLAGIVSIALCLSGNSVLAQMADAPDLIYPLSYGAYDGIYDAGDINNDGFDDVIITNSGYTFGGISNRGKVDLLLGSAIGLNLTPFWTIMGDSANVGIGGDVTIGDFNNDGLKDIAVSTNTPYWMTVGKAWVFMQTVSGLSTTPSKIYYGPYVESRFGDNTEAVDFNHDNYDDLIVTAPEFDNTFSSAGKMYIYYGSAIGLANTPSLTVEGNRDYARIGNHLISGDFDGDGYSDIVSTCYSGISVNYNVIYYGGPLTDLVADDSLHYATGVSPGDLNNAGDINGDGKDDIVFTSGPGSFINVAVVQYGSDSGLDKYEILFSLFKEYDSGFGTSVQGLGDINGDGLSDILIGEPYENTPASDAGRLHLFYGDPTDLPIAPDWSYRNTTAGEKLGFIVRRIGDINGDGFNDAAAGFYSKSELYIFLGSEDGLSSIGDKMFAGTATNTWYGYSVDELDDYNNDGYDDFVVGSPGTGFTDGKGIEIVDGSSAGPVSAEVIFNEAYGSNGYQVRKAGDINGDAKNDLLVSGYYCSDYLGYLFYNNGYHFGFDSMWTACAYNYNDQPFRVSVNSAGDVNNDGFDDFLMGGLGKSSSENHPTASAVRLFFGYSDMLKYDTVYVASADSLLWFNNFTQDSCDFGRSMAALGDINGDSYDDFFVSAPRYDNGETNEGINHIYLGVSGIPSYTPYWTFESNQVNAQSGYSAAAGGDINGDGYNDLLIGAPYFDNGEVDEGRVFIFYGTASGFPLTPSATLESNQAGSNFGIALDFIGDYNGDGFSDIVIGAHKYDNAQTDEGRIFIYTGSPSGISGTPLTSEEVNQTNAYFGFSVSAAGDVNNDGFDDVIAGAYNFTFNSTSDGIALLFYGEGNPCEIPTTLIVTGITATAANVSWTPSPDALNYNFRYRIIGAATWIEIVTPTPSILLTGLTSCADYEFEVQSACGGLITSAFTSTVNFTTVCPCATAPSGLFVDNITPTSAKLHWIADPSAIKYKVTYRPVGGSWVTLNATTNLKTITALTPGTTYQWKVKTICSGGLQSPYSTLQTFTLPLKQLEEILIPAVNIYPNPSSGTVNVTVNNFSSEFIMITMVEITGKVVYSSDISKEGQVTTIENLAHGMYFLTIKADDWVQSYKVLIQ